MTSLSNYSEIGLLAGVFDPIHIGHLHMAYIALEEALLTEVWFVPTHVPPHKSKPIAPYEHRVNMLRLAIAAEPRFRIVELEPDPRPTYTYETLTRVREMLGQKPCFIIGGDEWNKLHQWKEYQLLISNATFVVIPRREPLVERAGVEALITPATPIDLSSTYIRTRISQHKSIKYLVPNEVEKYIEEHKLYEKGGV
ncbi:nicotinate (nicotinamide) nucleotide adenylyltransferase [Coprothermobacteraceae bacterium]|nr:nicotinate (nicotinamide) nucleotide adenylyltransferase [Coprothermobacteraceae bacterium]